MHRIVQIVDSLEAGGAERVAVNYANSLVGMIAFSGLVATRGEGLLKSEIGSGVDYLFLDKKHSLDFVAFSKLYRYCKSNRVSILHAHSSSFFTAVLIKLARPKIRIIWHDHYGMSDMLETRPTGILRVCSKLFDGVISVNHKLEQWAKEKLRCSNVTYLPNFVPSIFEEAGGAALNGMPGKKILCLANLRPQKNHMMLLEVAARIQQSFPEWTFHLVGKDFDDSYSKAIKNKVDASNLTGNVYFYNARNDASSLISECDVVVLTSISEGLPISLLEAGRAQKPVVVTAVGELPNMITNRQNGLIVPSNDIDAFHAALSEALESKQLRADMGIALSKTVRESYTDNAVISKYLSWIGKNLK